jgi:tetratricopeptide (TPR) repeat protein/tRNA A-37 threonylcarbamoyl transferase component Bud32
MACLDENAVLAYLARRLPAAETARADAHIDGCGACRNLMIETARLTATGAAVPARPRAEAAFDGATTIGRYSILGPVGAGATAVVYAAYDPQLDRRVALKLLRPGSDPAALQARLLREAQAMARLSHPNVLAVHEVGTVGERVFLAMEFVEGGTLRQWLSAARRTWREVLDKYLLAGHGLAAAHAAGLLHRDFKPDNVLVGQDGRVRVTDFGLVRLLGDTAPSEGANGGSITPRASSGSPLVTPLTQTDTVMGTPVYMSPEQLEGRELDARSDLFSLCVALYEGLFGERPFEGASLESLHQAVARGRVREPPRDSRVPGWLRRAVLRGLCPAPRDRYPSTEALLAALERAPAQRARRAALAAGALALLAMGALAARESSRHKTRLCAGAQERLVGAWDAERRAAVKAAFARSGKPSALAAARAVEATLDAYGAAWAAMRTEACEATRLRGEQSDELLDLRMQCLEDRRLELGERVAVLAAADEQVLRNAGPLVSSLPSLAPCASAAALRARQRPAADPASRAKHEATSRQIARARALGEASKYRDALPVARGAVEQARALGYAPLLARALNELGLVLTVQNDLAPAMAALQEADLAAESSHADEEAVEASITLAHVTSQMPDEERHAAFWVGHAKAALARLEAQLTAAALDHLQARLAHAEGSLALRAGKGREAIPFFRRAVALFEKLGKDVRAARELSVLATALASVGQGEEALRAAHRALESEERALGEWNLRTATALHRLGDIYSDLARPEEALPHYRRWLAITERELGPDAPDGISAAIGVGATLIELHRSAEALPLLQRAQRSSERTGIPQLRAHSAIWLACALTESRRPAEAIALFEQALRLEEAPGVEPLLIAQGRFGLARELTAMKRSPDRARRLAEQARDAYRTPGQQLSRAEELDAAEIEAWLAARAAQASGR